MFSHYQYALVISLSEAIGLLPAFALNLECPESGETVKFAPIGPMLPNIMSTGRDEEHTNAEIQDSLPSCYGQDFC